MKKNEKVMGLVFVLIFVASFFFIVNSATTKITETDLLGEWSAYFDCPNTIIIFQGDGKVRLDTCDGEYKDAPTKISELEIKGNKAVALFEGINYEFSIIEIEGESKLKVNIRNHSFVLNKVVRI